MIRRPPRSTQGVSSAASDVYKRQGINAEYIGRIKEYLLQSLTPPALSLDLSVVQHIKSLGYPKDLSLIHISEPTRPLYISYAVFCLKKKKKIYNTSQIL
eukprot:TRINITY_DN14330_c0_g1_i1.p2 TRINITY_DN14330_c0_g1~~TRINITY_DN14330_c0_g1_i1.p2  ORF type:complete len:100 (-),score=30.94 TRINITY_DN14330_c0_g1_i1:113-412(-)